MSFGDSQVWSDLNKRSRRCQAVGNVRFGSDRFGGFLQASGPQASVEAILVQR